MTTTTTAADVDRVLDELAAQVEIPVHTGLPQAQGDLLVLPADGKVAAAPEPIPPAGVPLVRGAGGHVHLLIGRGVHYAAGRVGAQTIGTVTVDPGGVGYLAHGDGSTTSVLSRDADHDLVAFGPGTYVVRRQREQAEDVQLVAD